MADRAHTATPWTAKKARTLIHIGGRGPVCEISVSADHVHEDFPGCKAAYIAQQEANAEFIVKACNAHDELLAALKGMTRIVKAFGSTTQLGAAQKRRLLGAQAIADQLEGR